MLGYADGINLESGTITWGSVFHVHVKSKVVCGYNKKERPNVLCGER